MIHRVTLTGAVDWASQRHIAARAVGQMRGIRGLTNAIEVRRKVARGVARSAPGVSAVVDDLVVE
ncbi:putative phospholipid-binding protein [Burkholderia sp. H160]|nr:putative phospholipid-binding protein [Burkholderia sp. H160]